MIPSASTQFGMTPQKTYAGDTGNSTGLLGGSMSTSKMAANVASSMAAFKKEKDEMAAATADISAAPQAVETPSVSASVPTEQGQAQGAATPEAGAAQEGKAGLFERITSGEFGDEAAAKLMLATRNDTETSATIKKLITEASPENVDKVVAGINSSIKPRNQAEEIALESLRASINDPFMAAVSKVWNKGAEVAGDIAKGGVDMAASAIPGGQLVREVASKVSEAIPTLEDKPTDTALETGLKTVGNLVGGVAKTVLKPEDAIKSIIEGFNPVEGAAKLQGTGLLTKNQTVAQAVRDAVMTAAQFMPGIGEAAIGKVSKATQRMFSSIPKERMAKFMDNASKGEAIAAAAKTIDEAVSSGKITSKEFMASAKGHLSDALESKYAAVKNSKQMIPVKSIWENVRESLKNPGDGNTSLNLEFKNGKPVITGESITPTIARQVEEAVSLLQEKLGNKTEISASNLLAFKKAVGYKAKFGGIALDQEVPVGKELAQAVKNGLSNAGDIIPEHKIASELYKNGVEALEMVKDYAMKELADKAANKTKLSSIDITRPATALSALKKTGYQEMVDAAGVKAAPTTALGKVGAAVKFGAKKTAQAGVRASIANAASPADTTSGSGATLPPEKRQEIMARLNQLGL